MNAMGFKFLSSKFKVIRLLIITPREKTMARKNVIPFVNQTHLIEILKFIRPFLRHSDGSEKKIRNQLNFNYLLV